MGTQLISPRALEISGGDLDYAGLMKTDDEARAGGRGTTGVVALGQSLCPVLVLTHRT